jgi:RimJ/RimL family protein N-acetyltransferase
MKRDTYLKKIQRFRRGLAEEGTLYVVTDPDDIPSAAGSGAAFVYYSDISKKDESESSYLDGVKYVLEGEGKFEPEEFDDDFLENVYRRLKHIPLDILETERCLLRETWIPDLDSFYEIYSDASVTKYMEDLMERNEEEKYTENYRDLIYEIYGHGIWTVILKETGEIIGRAGLDERAGYDRPELGFLIGPKWQKKGYAEEVCRGILKWASENDIDEVMSITDPENIPSVNLLKKLGFTRSERFDDKRDVWIK